MEFLKGLSVFVRAEGLLGNPCPVSEYWERPRFIVELPSLDLAIRSKNFLDGLHDLLTHCLCCPCP